ncbi:LysR family transcriptional regulator [Aliiroseovarius sp. F47248L]|uniref:LysR family transcriptional regulator n=1 Tax=Aliiroseovarius sp. F47248L TaxID=2926420 RepID=UPI001FF6C00F|nr:LysR family transcriptional regulator [Aliiroseovarius sp. F47248L]MCK0138145.1 LysR family transcriptional regulator [Aliiroseovarius sp. F47248L]
MINRSSPALLFEMLRSFASLARTLNLSESVRELDSTRQTVRRHIASLESYKGCKLFSFDNRQYQLTEDGKNALREAEELIARGDAWLHDESKHVNELYYLGMQIGDVPYYLQQHPLTAIWDMGSPLIQFGFHAWAGSEGALESPVLAPLRPYLMVFRYNEDNGDWICTEVGEKSSYATWFGWEKYRSSVGKGIANLPGGPGFANLLAKPFHDIATTRGIRLDHIHTRIGHGEDNTLKAISYQRLAMACRFADGEFALATLIDRTRNVQIANLSDEDRDAMDADLTMKDIPPDMA